MAIGELALFIIDAGHRDRAVYIYFLYGHRDSPTFRTFRAPIDLPKPEPEPLSVILTESRMVTLGLVKF